MFYEYADAEAGMTPCGRPIGTAAPLPGSRQPCPCGETHRYRQVTWPQESIAVYDAEAIARINEITRRRGGY